MRLQLYRTEIFNKIVRGDRRKNILEAEIKIIRK